jgi:hypothetical protein
VAEIHTLLVTVVRKMGVHALRFLDRGPFQKLNDRKDDSMDLNFLARIWRPKE